MSNVYLHSKNSNDQLLKLTFILFIPFLLLGFYKNGLSLMMHDYNYLVYLKPFIFFGISLLISLIIKLIYKEKFFGNNLLENIIISLIVIPNTNIITYAVLIIVLNFLREYLRFNKAVVFMILNIAIMFILKDYTFLNLYELSVEHSYSIYDLLMGKGYGGIGNTFLIMSFISLCLLCKNMIYKKETSLSALITYYILITIYSFVTGNLDTNLVFNNNLIFAYIFIVPISIYSPYSRGASYIYGVLIGILTFASVFIDINIGIYVSILIANLLSYLFDNMLIGKTNQKIEKKA